MPATFLYVEVSGSFEVNLITEKIKVFWVQTSGIFSNFYECFTVMTI